MAKQIANTKGAAQTATVSAAVFNGATSASAPVNGAMLRAWFNGPTVQGNIAGVQVVPLANVQLGAYPPLPFGYSGSTTGVRATIQNWLLYGVIATTSGTLYPKAGNQQAKGGTPPNRSLQYALRCASKLGHSATNPNCLLAMLNGGYSRSMATYGTPFVKLVYKPTS
tara:strand:- start:541 stop:1044 length:504 start_codon:yes stop_codon:yes gene_type:complete